MRVLWIGGNHTRHYYFANSLAAGHELGGCIVVGREASVPQPPAGIPEGDRLNFVRHFQARDDAERRWFGVQQPPDTDTLRLEMHDLNTPAAVDFVAKVKPDAVFILGSGLIKAPLTEVLPRHTINLHLGLSPRYRGAATLFWPFFAMEPNWAGTTFHYILAEPDAGPIVHQVVPHLAREDGIHDVSCKAVVQSATDARGLLEILAVRGDLATKPQKVVGRTYFVNDFRPAHLRVNYDLFGDRMAAAFLDGELLARPPTLFRQF